MHLNVSDSYPNNDNRLNNQFDYGDKNNSVPAQVGFAEKETAEDRANMGGGGGNIIGARIVG